MEINELINYFSSYGMIFVFIIVFLEYLNLPGLPAGIILPLIGVLS
ncbi:DedA protein [Clostridium septicum]